MGGENKLFLPLGGIPVLARSILARLLGSADDCSVLLEEEDDALHASVRARLTALGIGGGRAAS